MPTDKPTKSPVKHAAKAAAHKKSSSDNTLGIVSMVLGVTSLTGPGLLFGIPAIILGSIALKKNQGERVLSMTGLVTGIISTVLSILVIIGLILLISWGEAWYETQPAPQSPPTGQKI